MRAISRFALVLSFALAGCDRATPPDAPVDGSGATTTSSSTGSASTSTGGGAMGGPGGTGGSSGTGGASLDACKACGQPEAKGKLESAELLETSGLAASALHPGVFYAHNDSGDAPRFFAIDGSGKELGRYEVDGAFAVDWEDAASGPCPAGRCVFFADIGDNLAKRSSATVYRVTEPAAIEAGVHHLPGEALTFSYPDGSHDAETLLVHPSTGEIFVVTKVVLGPSTLYRFPMPLTPGVPVVLEKVGTVEPPGGLARFTGGSIHPKGAGILLRAYTALYFFPTKGTVAETLAGEPCSVPVAVEKQGEAVEWTAAGDGWVTVSEGMAAPVNVVSCP